MNQGIGLDTILNNITILTDAKFKDALEFLLNSFTDEIPKDRVDSTTPYYKVRKGWFLQVALLIQLAQMDKLIPSDMEESCEAFFKHISSDKFKERFTTSEDINWGNTIIRKLINRINESQS